VTANAQSQRTRPATLLVPAVAALAALAVLVGLGVWQLQRKAWKEGLIAQLEARVTAVPVALPEPARWLDLDQDEDEFRRVGFTAEFVPGQEALVYTSGSSLRPDVTGQGYWVFALARLANGMLIVVNRGFVPEGRQNPAARAAGQLTGTVEMVGVLRWPEARGLFAPDDTPDKNLWFVRDHYAIAAAKGWNTIAPFFVDLESPVPPGGLPRPGKLAIHLRNDHLQYALTWFGLALVLVVMFGLWARTRLRQPRPGQTL
jgi:surfeit locus 1 family protein